MNQFQMKTSELVVALLTAFVATSSLLMLSCASEPQPSDSYIEKALGTQLPAFTRLSKLSVEAKQNLGTKVEPVWQARIRATITIASDTFALENEYSEVTFVQPVKRSGETIEVFGKSVSKLYAGAWRTTIELDGQPIATLGQPLSAFGSKKVIVRGSQEEKQYFADASKLLVGGWRGDSGEVTTYDADGTRTLKYEGSYIGTSSKGTWSIDSGVLTSVSVEEDGKPLGNPKTNRYTILEITGKNFVFKTSDGKVWREVRVN
jgi:hypothetical protein